MKYARRVDANQGEIVRTLEALGAGVEDCSRSGNGHPDLLVYWRGQTLQAEVKDGSQPPSRRELTGEQVIWHARARQYGIKVHVLTSVDDAMALLGARVSV